jgi:hypothetical protein
LFTGITGFFQHLFHRLGARRHIGIAAGPKVDDEIDFLGRVPLVLAQAGPAESVRPLPPARNNAASVRRWKNRGARRSSIQCANGAWQDSRGE